MKYLSYLLLLLVSFSAQAQSIAVTPGVTAALAAYRSRTIQQVQYTLGFDLSTPLTQPVNATATIRFLLTQTTQPVQLDFKALPSAIKSITVNGKAIAVHLQDEHIVIAARWLQKGNNSILLHFTAGGASLNRNADYLYTLLVPERARTVFPCFDQPDIKTVFRLSLRLPLHWKAVANGVLQDSARTASYKTYRFLPSDTISTYLFAFAAGEFSEMTRSFGNHTLYGLYRETDTTRLKASLPALFSLQANALRFMEDYTQIPYPFRHFSFAALPDFQFGGMEHPGAISYNANSLFFDSSATKDQLNARSNLLSHETAHMWFGDLVTMQWFNDVWMKEVFANFMADKIANLNFPDNNYALKFLSDHYPTAYATDRTQGTHPIRQQLDNLKDAGSLYGNIIYHKAPIMMRQLELLMGADSLRAGLREYLRTYAFHNASWPDLINILDRHCSADLQAWNKVWVNESSRPVFNYAIDSSAGTIRRFSISQHAEDGSHKIWPQVFDIALLYTDSITRLKVQMDSTVIHVPALAGHALPNTVVFNSTGEGYGVFPVYATSPDIACTLPEALMRAELYLDLYENMLNERTIQPLALLKVYQAGLVQEREELNLGLLLDQLNSIFWRYLTPSQRNGITPALEIAIWDALAANPAANQQKLLFKAYSNIAVSHAAQAILYAVWKNKTPPAAVKLSEDDYTNLAAALCIRDYAHSDSIMQQQLQRIQNPDRRRRWQYLLPALSSGVAARDSFFASLKKRENRAKEAWVSTALGYLHHPLRSNTSFRYLLPSLNLLEEIQQTGDIFFPQNWLAATLGYYQTSAAANVVRSFLQQHPQYNPKLRDKILQAADNTFRAEKLLQLP